MFAKKIGDRKAKCYIDRYPDLQAAFKGNNPIE